MSKIPAALVEEATAAAQSLNEQAASLTQLMSRFQIGAKSSERSPLALRPSVTEMTPNKVTVNPASGERRALKRPWVKKTASSAPRVTVAATTVVQAAAGAAVPGDTAWTQF
jgi:methyl-accepting chemotaxis protein